MADIFYIDLHVHSPYAGGASKYITLTDMARAAKEKGISVMGTGDCLHPEWLKTVKQKLAYNKDTGLYCQIIDINNVEVDNNENIIYFVPTVEIECVHKLKRFHILLIIPTFEEVDQIATNISKFGVLYEDGRPRIEIDPKKLIIGMKKTSPKSLVIPAHIMTPWVSLFGWKNTTRSVWDVFDRDNPPDALETGLSADPLMIRRISELDQFPLVSFSDAHSVSSIGREVTVFYGDIAYENIYNSIKAPPDFDTPFGNKITTLEYPPQLGKYFLDGHRNCNHFSSPTSSPICPICKRKKTLGVMRRIMDLADQESKIKLFPVKDGYYFFDNSQADYRYIVPLDSIVSAAVNKLKESKEVKDETNFIKSKYVSDISETSEINLLLHNQDFIFNEFNCQIMKFINQKKFVIKPGYDGVFGKLVDPYQMINILAQEANEKKLLGENCKLTSERFKCNDCNVGNQKMCRLLKTGYKLERELG
jgi:uncharacterized protein (TIGR00375 family)